MLDWESTYAIAIALKKLFPSVDMEKVSLNDIYRWTIALEGFEDDSALVNDEILMDIYKVWLEESLE